MEEDLFKIDNIGVLKYNRLKSISVLKHDLESFGVTASYNDARDLLDQILNNNFNDQFGHTVKYCLKNVFHEMTFIELYHHENETNFSENYIPPIG